MNMFVPAHLCLRMSHLKLTGVSSICFLIHTYHIVSIPYILYGSGNVWTVWTLVQVNIKSVEPEQ